MKKAILFLLIAIITLYTASAACEDQRACQNQDDKFYCSPGDTSCEYRHFVETLGCVVDDSFTDVDTDGDLWTNNCDALPNDFYEWFDMDGDGFGHVYDCDDFDKTIGENCDPDGDGQTNEDEHKAGTNPRVNGNSGGGGSPKKVIACRGEWDCSEWSEPNKNCGERTCTNTNGCSNNKPNELEPCAEYRTVKYDIKSTNEPEETTPEIKIEEKKEPEEDTGDGNRLTGQVFNTEPGNFKPASLWLLLIIVAGILGLFFWKRKKKEQVYSF